MRLPDLTTLTPANQIPGDTIPTVSVIAVYTPPIPGDPWQAATFYPAGSVVTDGSGNGHYFVASTGGVSANGPATGLKGPALATSPVSIVYDGSAQWLDNGYTQPQAGGTGQGQGANAPGLWQGTAPYASVGRNFRSLQWPLLQQIYFLGFFVRGTLRPG